MWSAIAVIAVGWTMGQPRCIGFGGTTVDEAISQQLLGVVQPVAVEAAIMASEEQFRKRDEVVEALRRDLEAARYSAQRAQKQYDHADPLCVFRRYVALKKMPLGWSLFAVPTAHN